MRSVAQQPNVSSAPYFVGNVMITTAFNSTNGLELWWQTIGTRNLQPLKELSAGPASTVFGDFKVVGDVLFFVATTPEHGTELWRTDGTREGTKLLSDLNPGLGKNSLPNSSNPKELTVLGNTLFFVAETANLGRELFRTSGNTAESPLLVRNSLPGPLSGLPSNLTVIGNSLYFAATTLQGRELWRAYSDTTLNLPNLSTNYRIGDPPTPVAATAILADSDTTNFRGAQLRLSFDNLYAAGDAILLQSTSLISFNQNQIVVQGVTIGQYSLSNRELRIKWTNRATADQIQTVIRSISFSSTNMLAARLRVLRWEFTDGEGGMAVKSSQIQVNLNPI